MSLIADNISIGYDSRALFEDLHFCCRPGTVTVLLGRNGIGKSTLLKTVCGLLPALKGEVLIEDRKLSSLRIQERAMLVSVVSTERPTVEYMRIDELLMLGRYAHQISGNTDHLRDTQAVEQALAQMKLLDLRDCYLHQLSDGQKQRAMIARALVQDTPLMVLDEPAAFLDYSNKYRLMELLKELATATNKTVFMSSHDLEAVAGFADQLLIMYGSGQLEILAEKPFDVDYLRHKQLADTE